MRRPRPAALFRNDGAPSGPSGHAPPSAVQRHDRQPSSRLRPVAGINVGYSEEVAISAPSALTTKKITRQPSNTTLSDLPPAARPGWPYDSHAASTGAGGFAHRRKRKINNCCEVLQKARSERVRDVVSVYVSDALVPRQDSNQAAPALRSPADRVPMPVTRRYRWRAIGREWLRRRGWAPVRSHSRSHDDASAVVLPALATYRRPHILATIVAMTILPLGDARDRFSSLVASVENTHDRVTVTRNGVPAAVLISSADLDELEETIAVLSSPDLLRQLGESADDLDRGDVLDADDDRDALLEAIRSRTDR